MEGVGALGAQRGVQQGGDAHKQRAVRLLGGGGGQNKKVQALECMSAMAGRRATAGREGMLTNSVLQGAAAGEQPAQRSVLVRRPRVAG